LIDSSLHIIFFIPTVDLQSSKPEYSSQLKASQDSRRDEGASWPDSTVSKL